MLPLIFYVHGALCGYYGAARSIYSRFIATGHDVVFPRDTQIDIRVGKR